MARAPRPGPEPFRVIGDADRIATLESTVVRIRMQRLGRTHRPFYRINAVDGRVKRDGVIIENLGWYNPVEPDPEKQIELKPERIQEWLAKGAQPSDTMMDILGNRDMLPAKMKAAWEAKRATDRKRGECKKAVKAIEGLISELEQAEKDGGEVTAQLNTCKKQLNNAKNSVANALNEHAEAALAEANKAADEAKKAAAKPAEEEAPAEAEASADGDSEA